MRFSVLLPALLVLAGCATTGEAPAAPGEAGTPGTEAPGPREPDPRLPPIPAVDSALDLRVSYPRDSAFVATRGENFIFGSAGSGRARVWIDGQEVDVRPNGGFLAFLPVPPDGVYRVRAELDGATDTLRLPVQLPPADSPAVAPRIEPGSVYPTGAWIAQPGERVEVGFRGTAGGQARVILPDGQVVTLVETTDGGTGATDFEVTPGEPPPADAPLSWYRGYFTAQAITAEDPDVPWPSLSPASPAESVDGAGPAVARLTLPGVGLAGPEEEAGPGRTDGWAEVPIPLNLVLADPDRPRVGTGYDPDPPAENGDGAIIARPGPGGGPYHYVWQNGARLTLTGERNGIYRVRLAEDLDVWSPAADIILQPAGTPPPSSRVAVVRLDPRPRWIDVHVALDERLPYRVDEDDGSISLTVYGANSRANFLQHGRVDPYIERAEWRQPTSERFVLDVHLAGAPWGYETYYTESDDLVLRVRRPPTIDPAAPLRGLTIGVDPGHGGADRFTMGPTGLTEADANLGIALALRDALERRGARVILTRTEDATVSLVERTQLARNHDVDLWVSTHNNAFPDGVNPFENNGTSVYYNHPRAAGLAWAVHRELLAELGLRDLGVGRADLHQARFTWAPAILTETMFMMIPEQEAALRTEEVRRRIAEAHARGMEEWVRSYPGTSRDRQGQ